MKRRNFLIGAIALPAWLSCAYSTKGQFAEEGEISEGSSLGRAFLQAQSISKPLLVLVVPALPYNPKDTLSEKEEKLQGDAYTARYERGHAFGELLNYGTQEQLWPLALCEVICALPREIDALTGGNIGSPLMVLIETNTARPAAISIDAALPELFAMRIGYEEGIEDKLITERIELLAKLIKDAIAPHSKAIKARVNQLQAALPEESKLLANKMSEKDFTLEQADRIAALVAQESSKNEKLQTLLLEIVKARLCKPPIDGSRWANSSGCGTTYEDPPEPKKVVVDGAETEGRVYLVVGCGMGHTPKRSQRFISFYTEEGEV